MIASISNCRLFHLKLLEPIEMTTHTWTDEILLSINCCVTMCKFWMIYFLEVKFYALQILSCLR